MATPVHSRSSIARSVGRRRIGAPGRWTASWGEGGRGTAPASARLALSGRHRAAARAATTTFDGDRRRCHAADAGPRRPVQHHERQRRPCMDARRRRCCDRTGAGLTGGARARYRLICARSGRWPSRGTITSSSRPGRIMRSGTCTTTTTYTRTCGTVGASSSPRDASWLTRARSPRRNELKHYACVDYLATCQRNLTHRMRTILVNWYAGRRPPARRPR